MTSLRSWFVVLPVVVVALTPAPRLVRAAGTEARITGTATYRERVALTPNAVFEAMLEDVSRVDAPAVVIARIRKTRPGQVPIGFEIRYDPHRIQSGRRYVVRATIHEGGRLRFTGVQAYRILTPEHSGRVAVLMRAASSGPGSAARPGLANTRWRPIRIGTQKVIVSGQQREPWIMLDPRAKRLTGSGGCNRISGAYEASRQTLRFRRVVSTTMACPGNHYESAFLGALNGTRRYRVLGRTLDLLDGHGRVLARLEERNSR